MDDGRFHNVLNSGVRYWAIDDCKPPLAVNDVPSPWGLRFENDVTHMLYCTSTSTVLTSSINEGFNITFLPVRKAKSCQHLNVYD